MIKSYGECALQARFKYIDRLPTKLGSSAHWGTSLHLALEHYVDHQDIQKAIEEFVTYYDSVTPDYWNKRTSYTGQLDMGKKILEEFADSYKWDDRVPIAQEHRFMVDIGEHQLSGIVDLLEVSEDFTELRIVDWKSGARPTKENLYLNVQFSAYLFASEQKEFWTGYPGQEDRYPGLPNGEELYETLVDAKRRGIWYDLRKNEEIDVGKREFKDYARLYRAMEMIAKAVEHEVYVPSISAATCGFCDFQEICPVYFENRLETVPA